MINEEKRIVIAGFGGQGIVLAGNVIGRACVLENKNVTAMVSYGAEIRGGTANTTVVISEAEIASPVVENPDIAIILNQPSLDKFEERIVKNGLVILNSSLVQRQVKRQDLDVAEVAATEIAQRLGNTKVANIVCLGAFIKKTGLLKADSLLAAIEELFSEKKPDLIDINKKALQAGLDLSRCEPQMGPAKA